jgi:hypothetical protein
MRPDFKKYKSSPVEEMAKLNYIKIPINRVEIEEYNNLVEWCRSQKDLKEGIKRTHSGGICTREDYMNRWSSTPRTTRSGYCLGAELLIIYCRVSEYSLETFCGRFQIGTFRGAQDSEKHLFGRQAYFKFKEMLEKKGLNIEDKMLPSRSDGLEWKKKIENPLIQFGYNAKVDTVYDHVYHIDRNSSFAAGCIEIVPEWKEVIQKLYDERKTKMVNKDILNMSIGFFQSAFVDFRLSHISEHCIRRNNEEVAKKAIELIKNDCQILLFNTDGIWFTKPEGLEIPSSHELGGFKIDHKDCRFRMKSVGCYEFIENGKYYPVVRGQTEMDKIKNRTEWEWGDIYAQGARIIAYEFKKDGTIGKKYIEDITMED